MQGVVAADLWVGRASPAIVRLQQRRALLGDHEVHDHSGASGQGRLAEMSAHTHTIINLCAFTNLKKRLDYTINVCNAKGDALIDVPNNKMYLLFAKSSLV